MSTQPCPASTDIAVKIQEPDNPLIPTVSISTSATIGECADMIIDPTGSTGAGGRDWSSIEWVIAGDGSQNETNLELASSLMNSKYANTKSRAIIPSKYIDSGSIYTLQLTLENFLNQKSRTSTTVEVTSVAKQPVVSIVGAKKLSKFRSDKISLFAAGKVPVCDGVADSNAYSITYTWKVYIGSVYQSTIVSESKDPRYFKLSAYTLNSNTVYSVFVTADLDGATAKSSVTIEVGSAGVVASILGGAKRSGSTTKEVLFESGSYSIDYPTDPSVISYQWTCSEVSPLYGSECPALLDGVNTAMASIAADAFTRSITASYLITLFVEDSSGTYSASAKTEIEMVSNEIPDIAFGATEAKYNPTQKIILSSTISTIGPAWITWNSSEFNATQWAAKTLTSTQYQVPTGILLLN